TIERDGRCRVRARPRHLVGRRHRPVDPGCGPVTDALTARVSVVVPAFNEGPSIGALVSELRQAASWHEVIVVDDGSVDDTAARASAAGARVVRHPYNKGNGAAVKTAIRNATGEFILIVDADGQHRADDAVRLVS